MKKFPQFVSILVLMILVLSACAPVSVAASLPTEVPARTSQPAQPQTAVREAQATLRLVVYTSGRTIRIVDANIPLGPTDTPTFNGLLPSGGSVAGTAYVLDPTNQVKGQAIDKNGAHELSFIQNPTPYGLAIWQGGLGTQPRLAWGTQLTASTPSSSLRISGPDGSQLETLLTQDATTPPLQLVAEFWSADGQSLYFSKEPVGLGGYILFGGASNLYRINITTKEVTEVIPLGPSSGPQACLDAISRNYRYVADHCSQKIITIHDLSSGGTIAVLPPADLTGSQFVGSARFSPNGSRLAFALARGDQDNELGWVAVSDGASGKSKLILTGQPGTYFTVAGWLDDQTLLVQSTNSLDCTPYCSSELWTVGMDGTNLQKAADGSLLTVITNGVGEVFTPPADASPTVVPATATQTALPQPAATQTAVPQPAATSVPAATECQDAAQYITDDGMDGTIYAPNTPFTKTWTLKNTGSCTWDSRYLVSYISGTTMTQQPGYWIVPEGQTVAPGQTVNISIGMTSPVENGNYRSNWGLKRENGRLMPIRGGANGNSFYVKIKVNNGEVAGKITAASIDIELEQGSGTVCSADATYFVHAYLTADGPTSASYEIGSTAGQIPAGNFQENGLSPFVAGTVMFDQADTKTINLRFVGPYPHPDDITVNLRVNGGEWINTKLSCR